MDEGNKDKSEVFFKAFFLAILMGGAAMWLGRMVADDSTKWPFLIGIVLGCLMQLVLVILFMALFFLGYLR
jgi:hypothetical protein